MDQVDLTQATHVETLGMGIATSVEGSLLVYFQLGDSVTFCDTVDVEHIIYTISTFANLATEVNGEVVLADLADADARAALANELMTKKLSDLSAAQETDS